MVSFQFGHGPFRGFVGSQGSGTSKPPVTPHAVPGGSGAARNAVEDASWVDRRRARSITLTNQKHAMVCWGRRKETQAKQSAEVEKAQVPSTIARETSEAHNVRAAFPRGPGRPIGRCAPLRPGLIGRACRRLGTASASTPPLRCGRKRCSRHPPAQSLRAWPRRSRSATEGGCMGPSRKTRSGAANRKAATDICKWVMGLASVAQLIAAVAQLVGALRDGP